MKTVRKEMKHDAWFELIGSYHEEGGVICVSGPSGGVQTLGWDSNAYDYGVTHTHTHSRMNWWIGGGSECANLRMRLTSLSVGLSFVGLGVDLCWKYKDRKLSSHHSGSIRHILGEFMTRFWMRKIKFHCFKAYTCISMLMFYFQIHHLKIDIPRTCIILTLKVP